VKSRYGNHCSAHTSFQRLHGDVRQRPIRKPELKPYLAKLKHWRGTLDPTLWTGVDGQWAGVLLPLAEDQISTKFNKKARRAAGREILAIDAGVEDKAEIADLVLALWLLAEDDRKRFVNDKAFKFETARLVRNLAPSTRRHTLNPTEGKPKTYFTRTPAPVMEVLGGWLHDAYGAAGLTLARTQWARERELLPVWWTPR
jgi:hypothetical protein